MYGGFISIRDFFHVYEKAAWEKDVNAMVNLYDEKVLIFDMWGSKALVSGLNEWSQNIAEWLTSLDREKVRVSFEEQGIQEDGHLAFATALVRYQAVDDSGAILRSMRNRITLGFTRTDGYWKVRHQPTSVPIDGELRANLAI